MKYIRSILARWTPEQLAYLKRQGIEFKNGVTAFTIKEDKKYFEIIEHIKDAPNLRDRRAFIHFEKEEYKPFKKFMFWRGFDLKGQLYGEHDLNVWKKEVYGDICPLCFLPVEEQVNPFVFKREVTFSKKQLFFVTDYAHNYLFTDKDRYENILKKWGFKYRSVLIGKSKKISKNLVQLEIPVSPFKLLFGNSEFGKTFDGDGSGRIADRFTVCTECGKPNYNNQILDYFPDFEEDFDFNMVHTQEWFSHFHHIIISRKFAEFLIGKKIIKWDSSYLIPVKKFKT